MELVKAKFCYERSRLINLPDLKVGWVFTQRNLSPVCLACETTYRDMLKASPKKNVCLLSR